MPEDNIFIRENSMVQINRKKCKLDTRGRDGTRLNVRKLTTTLNRRRVQSGKLVSFTGLAVCLDYYSINFNYSGSASQHKGYLKPQVPKHTHTNLLPLFILQDPSPGYTATRGPFSGTFYFL